MRNTKTKRIAVTFVAVCLILAVAFILTNRGLVSRIINGEYNKLGDQEILDIEPIDKIPPICTYDEKELIKAEINITFYDQGGGLDSISIQKTNSSEADIPEFRLGTNDKILVKVRRLPQSTNALIEFKVRDISGNVSKCGPIIFK